MVTSVLSNFAFFTPKISVIHTLLVMVNVAPLYRPTLRVKISTRGRALLCQIVQKKVVIRVNPAARVKMCLKFRPHRDPCVEVRKVSEVSIV